MAYFFTEFSFVIPFFFTFALVYGLLSIVRRKDPETKRESEFLPKNVNVIIALVFALATASFEKTSEVIMQILPIASVVLIIIFLIIIIKCLFEQNFKDSVIAVAVLGIFLLAAGTFWGTISDFMNLDYATSKDAIWILGLVLIALMFYSSYKNQKSPNH